MRVLHFSDIHVGIPLRTVPLLEWLGKRAIGGVNLILRRRRHFAEARDKLAALDRFRRDHAVDLVLFTGDYTAMGLEQEFRDARAAVEPMMSAPFGFVGLPGNHDLYVPSVVRRRTFQRYFGDTLETDLPEYRVDDTWPLVRLIGERVAVVAVNSARPNFLVLSNGRIPGRQIEALRLVLDDDRLRSRYVFVLTHYAPLLEDGRRDTYAHGLRNADAFLAACAGLRHGAILCGHLHRPFRVRAPGVNPPVFCGGSATLEGREGFWVFDVDGEGVRATPGTWDGKAYGLAPEAALPA